MTRKFFISISDKMDVRRWTIDQSKGKRNHMEDMVDVQETNGTKYFAIFDGHSGAEAATFAKKNIWQILERDERLSHCEAAINDAFSRTQEQMWEQRGKNGKMI